MSETATEPAPPLIVRKEVIAAALSKRDKIAHQLQEARERQVAALAAATAAEDAVDAAIARAAEAGTDADPAVILPLQQAQAQVELQSRMVDHLEAMHIKAHAAIKVAMHVAHLGIYQAGIRMRISAAASIEEARQMALAAREKHKLAQSIIDDAHRKGTQHPQFNGAGGNTINMLEAALATTTEAEEREFWEARQATNATGPHA